MVKISQTGIKPWSPMSNSLIFAPGRCRFIIPAATLWFERKHMCCCFSWEDSPGLYRLVKGICWKTLDRPSRLKNVEDLCISSVNVFRFHTQLTQKHKNIHSRKKEIVTVLACPLMYGNGTL